MAKVASLEQAARMAGMDVRTLVATLRRAVGQEVETAVTPSGAEESPTEPPSWLDPSKVCETLDADAMLAQDKVPLTLVTARARELEEGDILRVMSSFRPTPLTDTLERAGYRWFTRQAGPQQFETFITSATQGNKQT